MAWSEKARQAAKLKRGFRAAMVAGKGINSRMTASDLRPIYQTLSGSKKTGYGTSRQALSIGITQAVRRFSPSVAKKPAGSVLAQFKYRQLLK